MKYIIAFKTQPIKLLSFKYFIAYFWIPFVKISGYFVGKLRGFFLENQYYSFQSTLISSVTSLSIARKSVNFLSPSARLYKTCPY